MRRSTLLPFVLAATLAACGPRELTRQDRAVEEQVIEGRLQAWERGLISLKPDSMAMVYEQSAAFLGAWPDGHRTQGWDQEAQRQKDFASRTSAFNFDIQEPVIDVLTPMVALVTFRHTSDVTDSTGRALYSGLGTMVWTKDPASKLWMLHTVQVSRTPPPPPQPSGARRR